MTARIGSGWELAAVLLVVWVAFASIPLGLGEIGISWDALNHHIYLGWTAEHPRFDKDYLAASYQSYQYPYLYWPVYRLSISGISGKWAGVVLATIHLVAVPPVWMIAIRCLPGKTLFDAGMRMAAVVLAFMSVVVLSLFDSTSNDLMAAAPLVWSLAFALYTVGESPERKPSARRAVICSGFFAGMSVAFKLSNGPLAILVPLLWCFSSRLGKERLKNVVAGCMAATIGYLLCYGYWGWQLWSHFGNPIYPFYDGWFEPMRIALGWKP